jgi:hypothetical protein
MVSTALAKYMCIDMKKIYLTAKLEYIKYMTIPFALFPDWIIEQYDLKQHALNGKVHLELRCAMWGLPQQEYWPTSDFNGNWLHLVTMNA